MKGTKAFYVMHEGSIAGFASNVVHKPLQQPAQKEGQVKVAMLVPFNTRLKSDRSGSATVSFLRDDFRVELARESTLDVRKDGESPPSLELREGAMHILNRGPPQLMAFVTPHGNGSALGTEYEVRVEFDHTIVTVFEGILELQANNDPNRVPVSSQHQGIVRPGQIPEVSPIRAENVIEWWLYYPGFLDTEELALNAVERAELDSSLRAYRDGNPVEAFRQLPPANGQESEAAAIYRAALDLAVGNVAATRARLNSIAADAPLGIALRTMIDAVLRLVDIKPPQPRTASEWLAQSYWHQARHELKHALIVARQAVKQSSNFGYAWARVAELEFGHGHTSKAHEAMQRALALNPQNAHAYAVRGFVLTAQNRVSEALVEFEKALELNHRLGDAWLGRGLCYIHQGKLAEGRDAVQTAVLVEPNRSLFRSYLGKAFSTSGKTRSDMDQYRLATNELAIARNLDTNDPTSWLYLGLLKQDHNRINESIAAVEKSKELNDSRALFRSRLLLDQDRAVRSASLASIYRDAGMFDVSLREAARAVAYDYANYSAHLFLANSYDALRDPTRFNLRYEAPWFNELLLANLQAPQGVPTISANISQQEYSRLFERDRLGLTTTTELRSDGQYRERVSQFGALGRFSYSLDLDWQRNEGVRPNNELSRTEWYSQLKYHFSSQDSAFALIKYQDYEAGDNFQYYDASAARPGFSYSETQAPMLLAGWHHEWSPGIHTLFLAGRLVNDQHFADISATQTIAVVNPVGRLNPRGVPFDVSYHSQFEIYSAELNQIFQRENHTDIVGARFQDGTFCAENTFANPPPNLAPLFTLPSVSVADNDFRRLSLYAYHHWEIIDGLLLIGGLAYDDLRYPTNFRRPPLNTEESDRSQVSPKAALLWDIMPGLRGRALYAQALGGVSYDESVRLEPTQLAGFSQSFRSLISESLVGSVEAPRYEIVGGAFDLRPWTNAWLSLQGEALREHVDREIGIFNGDFDFMNPKATPASTKEQFNYREFNARAIFNQIVGRQWSLEAQYQFTRSKLHRTLPDIAATASYARTTHTDADLHQVGLAGAWQHPSGFVARCEFWELIQQLGGSTAQPPDDDLPLLNLYVGYRFRHRRGEISFGVMNLCGEDYHFSPLNYHQEYPHKRTFYTRLSFNF